MPNKLGYALISAFSKNPNYISGNKKELNFLLVAEKTAEQTTSSQINFCKALTHYYCKKLSSDFLITTETLSEALNQGFLNNLYIIKYSLLLLYSQRELQNTVPISLSEISSTHKQLQDQIPLLKILEQTDFSLFMFAIKNFGFKSFMSTCESILIEKIYYEMGESYQKSSQVMGLPLTTLHSKRQKLQKERNS